MEATKEIWGAMELLLSIYNVDYAVPVHTHVPDIELNFLECRYSCESCKSSAVHG